MSAILQSLTELNSAIEQLETVAVQQEQKVLKVKQQDLFDKNKAANGNSGGMNGIDPSILAQKLDITIERIEQVLREG